MEYSEFKVIFDHAFQINHLTPTTEEQAQQFYRFMEFLLETNKTTNLTAIRESKDVIYKHFVDSALISAYIPPNATVLDLGCGPGFPSLPLAILRSDLKISALDSTAKKIAFVNNTAALLQLSNVEGISGRAEDPIIRQALGQFDVVVSRAVARLNVLCELCIPYVKVGGVLLAMKGSKAEEELTEAKKAIQVLGGGDTAQIDFALNTSLSQEARAVIQIQKSVPTPSKYPRPYANILKKPL